MKRAFDVSHLFGKLLCEEDPYRGAKSELVLDFETNTLFIVIDDKYNNDFTGFMSTKNINDDLSGTMEEFRRKVARDSLVSIHHDVNDFIDTDGKYRSLSGAIAKLNSSATDYPTGHLSKLLLVAAMPSSIVNDVHVEPVGNKFRVEWLKDEYLEAELTKDEYITFLSDVRSRVVDPQLTGCLAKIQKRILEVEKEITIIIDKLKRDIVKC